MLTDTHRHTRTHTDTHGHTRTHKDTHGHTRTAKDVLCVLTDSYGHPQTSCECWWIPIDVLCVLNGQPTRAKSPDQSTGWVSMLIPGTNVLIYVLMDSHRRPVCADGHTRTDTDSHGLPVCADGHTKKSCVC